MAEEILGRFSFVFAVATLQNHFLPIEFVFLLLSLFPFRWRAICGNGPGGRTPNEKGCRGNAQQSDGKQKGSTRKFLHQDSPPLLVTYRRWNVVFMFRLPGIFANATSKKKGGALLSAPPLLIPPGRERVKKISVSQLQPMPSQNGNESRAQSLGG
jgi:hypothetical protein